MFGLGFGELLVILVVVLLVFGPEKLPEIARTLGKTLAEMRRTVDDIKHELTMPKIDDGPPVPTRTFADSSPEAPAAPEDPQSKSPFHEPEHCDSCGCPPEAPAADVPTETPSGKEHEPT